MFHRELLMVGAECVVLWSSQEAHDSFIVSFAPEPDVHAKFDDYGWSSDDAFLYMKNLRDLLAFIYECHGMGHRFITAELVYADLAD